jgi:copper transport protein
LPAVASAHAHLTSADPAPDGIVVHAPAVASFLFDEPLNPALTRVHITNSSGRAVAATDGHLASGHNGELWQVPLPPLAAGTYSVFWTSESADDGHVMSSFYTFRVASPGGSAGRGVAAGLADQRGGLAGPQADTTLSGGAVTTALFSWLALTAQTLWLGALLIDMVVLGPARRAVEESERRLALAATRRLLWLARGALVIALGALVTELLSLALQGTGDDWARAVAPETLGGMLASQNGHLVLLRFATLLVALLLAIRTQAPADQPTADPMPSRKDMLVNGPQRSLRSTAVELASQWESRRNGLIALAALSLLLLAFSGHAANVRPSWLSYPIDWLHLLSTAAWAGGIAALAYGVLPLRRVLPPEERAPTILLLLDRFSPIAYGAVIVLTLAGLYNAVNHLGPPLRMVTTLYGQLLALKLGLVGVLAGLSASHVWGLRPRIRRAQRRALVLTSAVASVHEGLATLAARLRLEAGVGAAILLATALMGQALPPGAEPTVVAGTVSTAAVRTVAATVSDGTTTSDLRGQLTVAPPTVGTVTFTLRLWEKRAPITMATGAAIIHLYPVAQPSLRANLAPVAQGALWVTRGSLAAAGRWRADVLVRTVAVDQYRTLPFTFTVAPG